MKTISRMSIVLAMLMLLTRFAGASENTSPPVPEKAVCRACQVRGATHGDEDVVATREFDGKHYYFCSMGCAEAFDGFPQGYAEQVVPRKVPSIQLETLSGEALDPGDLEAKALLIDFWATWCAPCIEAMPKLAALHEELQPEGLDVVGVSIDEDAKALSKFMKKRQLPYSIVHDTGEEPAWYAFQVATIPTMVLVDGAGQIVGQWTGNVDLDAVEEQIRGLLVDAP